MAQNIYDDEAFFAAYNTLPRSQEGLAGAPEWRDLRAMIGSSAENASVLDLGCGYGWFCRWAREQGKARDVLGIDLSAQMLEKARRDWQEDAKVRYQLGDLDEVELSSGEEYGLVFSSLAFHYLRDVKALFRKVHTGLRPGGRLVFSIEHPLFTAPLNPKFDASSGDWTINSYYYEGERWRSWLGAEVKKQHHSLTTYMEALLEPGFRLEAFKEWKPTEEELKARPDWKSEMHRPIFLLIAASKQN